MKPKQIKQAAIGAARLRWASDDLQIDDNAQVTKAGEIDGGYWIRAWVYVRKDEVTGHPDAQ